MKTEYPNSLTIQQYLNGTLDPKLMHDLEKQALEDPFLFEALEGYSKSSESGHGLSILQRQLHERIMHLQENKKVYDFSWQRLSVAAAAAVMFITVGILFWMSTQTHSTKLAANPDTKQVDVNLTAPDTIKPYTEKILTLEAPQSHVTSTKPKISSTDMKSRQKGSEIAINDASGTATTINAESSALGSVANQQNSALKQHVTAKYADSIVLLERQNSIAATRAAKVQSFNTKAVNYAEPLIGWENFKTYLKENISYPKNEANIAGKVLLGFFVNQDGKPIKIRVLQGLTDVYNYEAIRLITNGPAWTSAPGNNAKEIKIEIEFN